MNTKTYKRKVNKRKTYRRKVHKRKTYRRKHGGNLFVKPGQVATRVITKSNLKQGFIDMGQGALALTKDIGIGASKGLVQNNTSKLARYVGNHNLDKSFPPTNLPSINNYSLKVPPPPNPNKIAPPPSVNIPENYDYDYDYDYDYN